MLEGQAYTELTYFENGSYVMEYEYDCIPKNLKKAGKIRIDNNIYFSFDCSDEKHRYISELIRRHKWGIK
jgi:hypothetical protein